MVPAAQWFHHLRIGNLTRDSESPHLREILARDPLVALVRKALIAFEDESTGQLKFEQSRAQAMPRRLVDGPPVSAQSAWVLVQEEFLRQGALTKRQADELTLALKPCVQISETFDPVSRLVDPGVTLYR